ncbi:MAG: peptidoglycan DD-metalloendopeptidase family protein [Methylococcaceae bacterium]|nr:peptidoglycan DD-metalloendopeptidase family protein [Methylococcaceae bacterium]
MRDRLIVTITDLEGTKHFNVHQIIRKVIFGIVVFILLMFIIGSIFITVLMSDVEMLEEKRNLLRQEKLNHEESISTLNGRILEKSMEIEVFTDKLVEIENLIGLTPNKDNENSIEKRIDLAKITSLQKNHMLMSIPNGNPLILKGQKVKEAGKITDHFGWRTHPIRRTKRFHKGTDFRAKTGTPVYATASGIVDYSGYHGKNGFGNLLTIVHNYGFKSYYAHLSKIDFKIGDIVSKGQQIALSGNTGLSSGPHLHYEVRYIGVPIDPINFINWDIDNYDSIFKKTAGIKWHSLVEMIAKNQQIKMLGQPLSPAVPK